MVLPFPRPQIIRIFYPLPFASNQILQKIYPLPRFKKESAKREILFEDGVAAEKEKYLVINQSRMVLHIPPSSPKISLEDDK